ncbi:ATP-binding protein [Streptomyces sp. NPDC050617]|uniref:ATP-binding protein n=1 Tax=Streptomyces sp. NPDC050617 TaxID=3154628 RepID=UPI003437B939
MHVSPPTPQSHTPRSQQQDSKQEDVFQLPSRTASVAEARHRTRQWLDRCAVPDGICAAAVLVVSELVTNAVVHTDSERISCRVRADTAQVRLEVRDSGSGRRGPRQRSAGPDAETGRGLLLVGSMADAWGVAAPGHSSGHTVWATLRITGA